MPIYPNAVSFMKAKDRQCRFFLPDQKGPDGLVCGDHTDEGRSFCGPHHNFTHQPLSASYMPKVRGGIDRDTMANKGDGDREPDLTEIFE